VTRGRAARTRMAAHTVRMQGTRRRSPCGASRTHRAWARAVGDGLPWRFLRRTSWEGSTHRVGNKAPRCTLTYTTNCSSIRRGGGELTMTNADRLEEALRNAPGPLCDDCAALEARFPRRQVAYMEAELLAQKGRISRGSAQCVRCGKTKKASWADKPSAGAAPSGGGWTAFDLSTRQGTFVLVCRQAGAGWTGVVTQGAPSASSRSTALEAVYVEASNFQDLYRAAQSWVASRSG
jgi:hypothetical protein